MWDVFIINSVNFKHYKNRVEEGFCVFRNGLVSISDWVFGIVWSWVVQHLFIMKTAHKSNELKKKKKGGEGGGPQIGYLWFNSNLNFWYLYIFILHFLYVVILWLMAGKKCQKHHTTFHFHFEKITEGQWAVLNFV